MDVSLLSKHLDAAIARLEGIGKLRMTHAQHYALLQVGVNLYRMKAQLDKESANGTSVLRNQDG